ncbi:cholesterol 25-hydroxylase [Takifugu flavidus]|uniref:Cholesterol 25-hydroxylase n=1 Tax=Takifugu flavidus TaxID=433684 RepID=A0A5C6N1W1_9TELE|nr:cholesterol 25-hydroxylase [Takifugu flavidus]TWW60728.1 Cholesterol 25-hydroxylase [Takifugu flavidus]
MRSDHGEVFLQQMWDYMRATNVLQSPVLPAFFAFLTHVLLCLPYLLLDMLAGFSPQVQQWRISAPPPTLRQWFFCFGRVLRAYLTAVLPVTALLQVLGSPVMPEHAPSCWQLVVEVSVCLLLFDAFFFAWHLFMHKTPWLYRSIHQAHHQQRQPFALTAQDAAGAELLSLLLLAMASARLVGCHPLSETVFHLVNTWLAVEDHCGYNLPWALHRLLPLMGGAPYHQDHHIFFRGNYAPYFSHWDRLFGTYYSSVKEHYERCPSAEKRRVNIKDE